MRKLAVFSFAFLPLLACTAILGDFTVGAGDGGGDADQGDVVTTDGGDSSTNLKPLKCGDNPSQRRQLTTGDTLNADRIAITLLPTGMARVVAVDYAINNDGGQQMATLRSYTYDPHQTSGPVSEDDQIIVGRVLDLVRYNGPSSGIAALSFDYQGAVPVVSVIPNDSNKWSPPQTVSIPISTNNNIDGELLVMDAALGEFYVVLAANDSGGQNVLILGGVAKDASSQLQQLGTFPLSNGRSPWGLVRPGIAAPGSGKAFIAFSPSGSNGPPPVDSPMMILSDPPGQPHMIPPPTGLNIFPAGLQLAADPQKTNTGFLIADLFFSQPPSYNIGQVQTSSLPNIDPGSLPITHVTSADGGTPSLLDVFVDQAGGHWEIANGTEQFLVVSPTADPVSQTFAGGMNFAWWEATTGINRAYLTGNGGKLIADVPFPTGGDVVINSLAGNIASLYLAFKNAKNGTQGNLPPPCDLWVANLGCAP